MAKTKESCFVNALFAIAVLAIAHFCNCESVLSDKEQDKVSKLPGQNFNVNFAHYSGFVTTNEKLGRALFYWLIEAAEDPASKPLVLWLNGGKGKRHEKDAIVHGKNIGLGFKTRRDATEGHYIPQLSQAIVRHNQASGEKKINLKGYMVGNGLMDDRQDQLGLFQYIWTLGFISDQTYTLLKLQCGLEPFIHSSEACNNALEISYKEMGNIDHYSVFTPACVESASQSRMLLNRRPVNSRVSEQYDPCTEKHSKVYFNLPEVQRALHVPPEVAPSKWDTCNYVVNENWNDCASSVLDIYHELIAAGIRIWVFSGDADAVVPVTSTRYSIDALNLSTTSPYGPWYIDGQVGGWTQQYAGLNFVTVRGAGHEVPLHRPKEALALFKAFISGTPLLSTPEKSIRSEIKVVGEHWKDSPSSVLDIYHELIAAGLRIWVFSGDADAIVPVTSTRYSINALNLSTLSPYGPWYIDGQVGGWSQQYAGLNFVIVRGSGHEVALHRPKEALALFKAFISGTPLTHDEF
ncbi:hypothetical protein F2Q68_00029152 [Brassica cretica]|uniref:Carboxypeptidase n=1 Tax=Brassica cretica TaxID=69181 RepID=A0A8S9GDS9_BRACR|nr:hypothetical protein F2Q68_00029152 [Brassica cretica]